MENFARGTGATLVYLLVTMGSFWVIGHDPAQAGRYAFGFAFGLMWAKSILKWEP